MQRLYGRLTTAQSIVIALSAMALAALAWTYHDRVSNFEAAHQTLARTVTSEAANQMAFILSERQRQVGLFAEYHLAALQAFGEAPDDDARRKAIEGALRHAFPDFFAFTVTDARGEPLIPDFDGYVGEICVDDIHAFAQTGRYQARIHPNTYAYHFDVIAKWTGRHDESYMLMVSFAPDELGKLLKAVEPPGHELMLITQSETPIIEVTAKGARDQTPRLDYRLTPAERERMLAGVPVAHSVWKVADLARPAFFQDFRRQALFNLGWALVVLVVLVGASLALLHREARRREAAEAARQELMSMITHELRTPVTALAGTLSLMANGVIDEAARQESFALLERNAERLRRLIDDLLEARRTEAGQLRLEKRRVRVVPIVQEAIAGLRDYASQIGVSVELADADPELWVDADPQRIQQVVTNLISNAAKYSPTGESVQVHVRPILRDSVVRVSISDRGPGIPSAFQAKLFQPFARGPAPLHRQFASTGLGLSIVKALVEAHGGKVGCDSVEGKGSTFYFDLPRARTPEG